MSYGFSHTREKKPCKRCGHVRLVKVNRYAHYPEDRGAGAARGPQISWAANCTACDHVLNAERKFQDACRFWQKALEGFKKRPDPDLGKLMQGELTRVLQRSRT